MKPFVFKLETLLEIRKKHEEKANIKLSQAHAALRTAKEFLQQLQTQQQESFIEFRQKQANKEVSVTDCQVWYNFLSFLKKEIEKQEDVVEKAKQEVLIALKEVEIAMKDRKTVERLKEKRLEQYRIELLKEEQKILDEIAVSRHGRQEGDEL